jgi:hypothetical protein
MLTNNSVGDIIQRHVNQGFCYSNHEETDVLTLFLCPLTLTAVGSDMVFIPHYQQMSVVWQIIKVVYDPNTDYMPVKRIRPCEM